VGFDRVTQDVYLEWTDWIHGRYEPIRLHLRLRSANRRCCEIRETQYERSSTAHNKRNYDFKVFSHDAGGTVENRASVREAVKPHRGLSRTGRVVIEDCERRKEIAKVFPTCMHSSRCAEARALVPRWAINSDCDWGEER
jgi:hypothetical protein